MGQIIVGMDTSPGAATALRWAVREGELRGWQVTAVTVWSYLDQAHAGPDGQFDPDYSEAKMKESLDTAIVDAVGAEIASSVGQQVICDLAAAGLLDASATADAELLVVGARGLGGFRALMLGSVSEQVLHHSTSPVAVVRSTDQPEPGSDRTKPERIVVGIDGSPHAQKALRWALDEARARQAILEAVYAWRSPVVGLGPGVYPIDSQPLEAEARGILEDATAAEDTSGLPAPIQHTVLSGAAAQVLIETAQGADLVVLGSRGLGGFKGLLLGSTSHQVARHAPCPVVVLPDRSTS